MGEPKLKLCDPVCTRCGGPTASQKRRIVPGDGLCVPCRNAGNYPPVPDGKRCNHCGGPGPFNRNKRKRDGLHGTCVLCRRTYMAKKAKEYREKWADKLNTPEAKEDRRQRSKDWRRRNYMQYFYGMSPEQFEAMWLAQEGRCGICRDVLVRGRQTTCIDHDHATMHVRGILCTKCNVGLGNYRDDPELLLRARDYLLAKKVRQ